MVTVYFGYDKSAVLDVDNYFNLIFEDDWLNDELVKKMIKGIDNSVVESPHCITSPVLGQIAPERLSGGVKTCIMLYKEPGFYTDLLVCGENCEPWLAEIFRRVDVKVAMSSYDLLFLGEEFDGICENDGSRITCGKDWSEKMLRMVSEYER